jgi:hypothetical protein
MTLFLDNYFERNNLRNASKIVFVTKSSQEDYQKKISLARSEKSHVLYWGYNEENFNIQKQASDIETVLHAGNIFDYQRYPWTLAQYPKRDSKGEEDCGSDLWGRSVRV